MSTNTTAIISIGHLAHTLRKSVGTVERAAKLLGVKPALHIDGVAHYDQDDAERLCVLIREAQPEAERRG